MSKNNQPEEIKNCLNCKYQPRWHYNCPGSTAQMGKCRSGAFWGKSQMIYDVLTRYPNLMRLQDGKPVYDDLTSYSPIISLQDNKVAHVFACGDGEEPKEIEIICCPAWMMATASEL